MDEKERKQPSSTRKLENVWRDIYSSNESNTFWLHKGDCFDRKVPTTKDLITNKRMTQKTTTTKKISVGLNRFPNVKFR